MPSSRTEAFVTNANLRVRNADQIVFVVTCTATLDEFAGVVAAFRRVLDTLQFFDPATANL